MDNLDLPPEGGDVGPLGGGGPEVSRGPEQPAQYLGLTMRVYTLAPTGGRTYRRTIDMVEQPSLSGFDPECSCPRCRPQLDRVNRRTWGVAS